MNSKLYNSVLNIYEALHEQPELKTQPNIAQLLGTIQLIGKGKALDMI